MTDTFATLISAAHAGAFGLNGKPTPTPAQAAAGNYAKGRIQLHGLDIAIETPQGTRRQGKSDGQPWSVICQAHYGDISGTRGADGDPVDVYVGPIPESTRVFVVNQTGKDGAFDEHKVMLGFADPQSARTAYLNSYERGWQGLGSMVSASVDQFKWWLKFGDTRAPFATSSLPHDGDTNMNDKQWDDAGNPIGSNLATLMYQLRTEDHESLLLDAVRLQDILDDSDGIAVLDALVVPYAKMQRKAAQLEMVMQRVADQVKVAAFQVSEPFKKNGVTHVAMVFELTDGQTLSIFFHNPDSTPNKLMPADEMVSWKWLLNKRDVTIVVAPEQGRDLSVQQVAKRIMRLAQQNSARFAKANADRADRLANIERMKQEHGEKLALSDQLDARIDELQSKLNERRQGAPAADPQASPLATAAVASAEAKRDAEQPRLPVAPSVEAVGAALVGLGWAHEEGATWTLGDYFATGSASAFDLARVGEHGIHAGIGGVPLAVGASAEGVATQLVALAAAAGAQQQPQPAPAQPAKAPAPDGALLPFEPANLKRPSAVALGLKKMDGASYRFRRIEGGGWTNGHLLDLTTPRYIDTEIVKVYGKSEGGDVLQVLPAERAARVVPQTPLGQYRIVAMTAPSLYRYPTPSGWKEEKIAAAAVVEAVSDSGASAGLAAIDSRYLAYFLSAHRDAVLFYQAGDKIGSSAIGVMDGETGKVLGALMPMKLYDLEEKMQAFAAAQTAPAEGVSTLGPGEAEDGLAEVKALLQSFIDGTADVEDSSLLDRLEAIGHDYTHRPEIMALFEAAVMAYSNLMVEKSKSVP